MDGMPAWYVYILGSALADFTYVGSTNSLGRRIKEHNDGLVQSTKAYRPLHVLSYLAVATEEQARSLERYFKTGSGRAVLNKRILGRSTDRFHRVGPDRRSSEGA